MARIVEVIPYEPAWAERFRTEVAAITNILRSNLICVHHIGSTAVPGLAAKPTIDILLVVGDVKALDASNEAIMALGYQPKGENGIPGRRYFQKLAGEVHLVHIHAFPEKHPEIMRYLNFRDYLIAHPNIARDYQVLKERLAKQYRDAPALYTSGKTDFIRAIDARAAVWQAKLDCGG